MPDPTPEQLALAKIEARTQAKALLDTAAQYVVYTVDAEGKTAMIAVAAPEVASMAAVAVMMRAAALSGIFQMTPSTPAASAQPPAVSAPPAPPAKPNVGPVQ